MRPIDRLFEFIQHKGVSQYEIENMLKVSSGYLGKQKKGKGSIGSEILEKILIAFPELNLLWLLSGEGIMLVSNGHKESLKDGEPGFLGGYEPYFRTSPLQSAFDSPLPTDKEKNGMMQSPTPYLLMAHENSELLRRQIAILLSANADKDKIIALLEQK